MQHIRTYFLSRYGAAILLCIVVLYQQYSVARHALTPWKGGGFGMFSTYDTPQLRTIVVTLVAEDGRQYVLPWDFLSRRIQLDRDTPLWLDRLRIHPAARDLHLFAKTLADSNWVLVEETRRGQRQIVPLIENQYRGHSPVRPFPLLKARVEVWRYRFEKLTRDLTPERIASVVAER